MPGRSNWLRVILVLVVLTAGLYGQFQLYDSTPYGVIGLIVAALGAALLLLLPGTADPIERDPAPRPPTHYVPVISAPYSYIAGGAAGMLAVLAFLWLGGNTFTWAGTLAWIGAVVLFFVALADRPATPPQRDPAPRWIIVALLLVFAVAAFYRFYRIDAVPLEMTSDHAEKLLDVNEVINGLRPVFFERNTGREPFQFYYTALIVALTPLEVSHLALKVGTTFFGLLAVPATYLLGCELYNRRVGLVAAALLALSPWHIAIGRVGLRFPFSVTFSTITLYFLLRAYRRSARTDWLLTGLMLGIGLLTYIPMRMVPPLLVTLSLVKLLWDWGMARQTGDRSATSMNWRFWISAVSGGGLSLIVFLPLLRYMFDHPDAFWFRVGSRVLGERGRTAQHVFATFADNNLDALLMFNWHGDSVFANTIPGSPVLAPVAASMLVVGAAVLLIALSRRGDRRTVYMGIMIFVMLLPSTLAIAFPEENPSVVRAGSVAPLVAIVAAVGLAPLIETLWGDGTQTARLALAGIVIVGLVGIEAAYAHNWYFNRYDEQYRRSAWNTREMGAALEAWIEAGGAPDHFYHVVYPFWADTRAIGMNAGLLTWENAIIDPGAGLRRQFADPAPKQYLLNPRDEDTLALLVGMYPEGRWTLVQSAQTGMGKDFILFTTAEP